MDFSVESQGMLTCTSCLVQDWLQKFSRFCPSMLWPRSSTRTHLLIFTNIPRFVRYCVAEAVTTSIWYEIKTNVIQHDTFICILRWHPEQVGEVQYGGKITDDLDRRLFKAYTETWMGPTALSASFSFNPGVPMNGVNHFKYVIPDSQEVRTVRAPSIRTVRAPSIQCAGRFNPTFGLKRIWN